LKYREIIFYKDYFKSFYEKQNPSVKKKLLEAFVNIEQIEKIPKKFFKHMAGKKGLYEIRLHFDNKAFRIFSFFDKGKLVVLANGFIKKMQKTPKSEILKAMRIKKEYKNEKSQYKNS
jgi:phage-related protein